MNDCIDIHTHIVPENFPAYAVKGRDVPWPAMAEAHACHRHVMISGKVYRTVADGSWSVPRRIEAMGAMRVARQALSPMPELLSYWLPADDAQVLLRHINDTIAAMVRPRPGVSSGSVRCPCRTWTWPCANSNTCARPWASPVSRSRRTSTGYQIGRAHV